MGTGRSSAAPVEEDQPCARREALEEASAFGLVPPEIDMAGKPGDASGASPTTR